MGKQILLIVAFSLLSTGPAMAGHARRHHGDGHWAKVVRVTPIHERVRVVSPRRECRTEIVTRHRHSGRRHAVAPTLFGAGIGSVIGRELGHDRPSRAAGSVFGAIIGGAIGHELGHDRSRHGRRSGRQHVEVERCEVRTRVEHERRVTGYEVAYKYRGRIYNTRMDRRPSRRIRVDVDARRGYVR